MSSTGRNLDDQRVSATRLDECHIIHNLSNSGNLQRKPRVTHKTQFVFKGKLVSATRMMPTQFGKKGRFSPPKWFHDISVLVNPYFSPLFPDNVCLVSLLSPTKFVAPVSTLVLDSKSWPTADKQAPTLNTYPILPPIGQSSTSHCLMSSPPYQQTQHTVLIATLIFEMLLKILILLLPSLSPVSVIGHGNILRYI